MKREDGPNGHPPGVASTHLHRNVQVGDELELAAPAGVFTLAQSARPIVFLAGGVGLTPLTSMFNTLLAESSSRPITFVQAVRNPDVLAMSAHFAKDAEEHAHILHHVVTETIDSTCPAYYREGRITPEWLDSLLPADREVDVYYCGPSRFMQVMRDYLNALKVPTARQYFEFFGPMQSGTEAKADNLAE